MLPLFDMMLQAQNGAAMEATAKQFGLAQEQVLKAMAALTPAFSSGLKRSATNPYDFSALLASMGSANYAKYFEDMTKAFTPQGVADGNTVLQHLFGSKEVSRAIAAQAAKMTGIGQEILKQMMPAMADTLMGGLFKQATGQLPASNPFANTPMGAMMEQWLESAGFAPKKPEPAANPFDNPFTQAFQQMMGMAPTAQSKAAANPFMDNPFAKAFQEMIGSASGQAASPSPEAKHSADGGATAFQDMLNSMFDSGLEVQKSYQKSMEQIFDSYLSASTSAQSTTSEETDGPEPKNSKPA
ncbi:DUF937 domain-containing protein [Ciceribacter sp. L1K23]|uniref:DUF937 domain-containing protein n=1 Tax=Ciceribacter sp. L1K23 TaxID=2820276 RepID=UPI001B82D6D4|nr:DUF937 domain-containing protein [Ciceribacter sp. L1K23]MBR0556866.1 DUF937 domain-containing protein [Ciceribacter sp. L1K23]